MRAILSSTSAAASASSSATAWNVNVVMDAIKAAAPSISWPRVAEALDYDGFSVPDAAGFAILMGAWRRATSEPFPLTAIAGRLWTNTAGQLSLLQQAVAAPPDLLSWERSPKKIQPLEGLGQGKSPLGTPNQAWASLDLLAVLAQMADLPAFSSSVLELLRRGPASQCPEVLVATTSLLRGPSDLNWGTLERFVWGSVAAPLLFESPAAASRRNVLLQRLWQQRRDHLLQCMANYKLERPDRAPELLEVVLELKGLAYTLDNGPPPLSVELACVAAQRTPPLVDLDTWLTNVLGKDANSGSVMQAALGFLEAQLSGIGEGRLKVPGSTGRPAPGQVFSVLSADSTTAFLRALYTAGEGLGCMGAAAAVWCATQCLQRCVFGWLLSCVRCVPGTAERYGFAAAGACFSCTVCPCFASTHTQHKCIPCVQVHALQVRPTACVLGAATHHTQD
jgi:CCR4-NOT transcription complex subunit 1